MSVLSLEEALMVSPDDLRADIIRSAARGQGPTFIAAKLDIFRLKACEKLLVKLSPYVKHKPGCASGWRAATGSSQIGPCDCGLSAAIASVEAKP